MKLKMIGMDQEPQAQLHFMLMINMRVMIWLLMLELGLINLTLMIGK